MKIGLIGAGKVGCTLAKYFSKYGIVISGFYSKSYSSTLEASLFTSSKAYTTISSLLNDSDCILITVPDQQITDVWLELCQLPLGNKFIGHCSGLLSSELFINNQSIYSFGFSLHPLYAIYDKFSCYQLMSNAYFTLQASEIVKESLLNYLSALPNPIAVIAADKKRLYHAACVMLSNQIIAIAKMGSDMLEQCNLDSQFSKQAWQPLFLGNAHSLCEHGLLESLTGPIERNDIETVKQHLAIISPDIKSVYQQLSLVLLDISQQKHPHRDYQQLKLELLP